MYALCHAGFNATAEVLSQMKDGGLLAICYVW